MRAIGFDGEQILDVSLIQADRPAPHEAQKLRNQWGVLGARGL